MRDAVAAEWIKVRTARATRVVLAVAGGTIALAGLLTFVAVASWDNASPERRGMGGISDMGEFTAWVTQFAVAVFGAVTITREYATGAIRTTLLAVPRRRRLLAAKAVPVTAVAVVLGTVVTFASYALSRVIIGERPLRSPDTPFAEHLPLLLASVLMVVVFGMVGLGLGAATRSTTATVTTLFALWYLLPMAVHNLPRPWNDHINAVLPGTLARQLAGADSEGYLFAVVLSPLWALVAMAGYVVVALGSGAWVLTRRDA